MKEKFTALLRAGTAFVTGLLLAATVQAKAPQWEQITLKGERTVKLADGSELTVDPSCSGGPVMTPAGPRPGNTDYSFFIKRGNPNKLLVAFDGGGACWNGLTCIASVLGGSPTYSREVDETTGSLEEGGGLLDDSNPANPYKEYTKVFVPYCTADVHWGSRDTTYQFNAGPPFGVVPWVIRHRGSDNVLAVVDWLQRNGHSRQIDLNRVHDLTVTGLSAGAYGTLNGFGFLAAITPNARQNLVADAGIGVSRPEFYAAALYPDATSAWGVEENLPPVPGFDTMLATASANPSMLVPLGFQSLALWKPKAHFASLTAELDITQVYFYALMKGKTAPDFPGDFAEWYFGMKAITSTTAALPNYRYFIDEGTFHTFLGSDEHTYRVGANGVSVAEWIREMIKPGNRTWENLEAPPPF